MTCIIINYGYSDTSSTIDESCSAGTFLSNNTSVYKVYGLHKLISSTTEQHVAHFVCRSFDSRNNLNFTSLAISRHVFCSLTLIHSKSYLLKHWRRIAWLVFCNRPIFLNDSIKIILKIIRSEKRQDEKKSASKQLLAFNVIEVYFKRTRDRVRDRSVVYMKDERHQKFL